MAEELSSEKFYQPKHLDFKPPNGYVSFEKHPYKKNLPPSLYPNTNLLDTNPFEFDCGKISCSLVEHIGEPMNLSPQHTLKPGDHYLDISFNLCDSPHEVFDSIKKLAEFLKKYPGIEWLVGTSWLASINGGKLIERFGFHSTDISVSPNFQKISKKNALSKPKPNSRYLERVKNPEVKFIYSPREKFLAKFGS